MGLHLHKKSLMTERWYKPFFQVSIPWMSGLLIGAVVAFCLSDNQQEMIRLLAGKGISPFGAIFSSIISFLIIVLAAKLTGYRGISVYLFVKATLFSLFFCYCSRCFGTSGWLVASLLFLTELVCSYCLLLFAFHLLTGKQSVSRFVLAAYSVFFVLLGLFHYFVLSPFTASLF